MIREAYHSLVHSVRASAAGLTAAHPAVAPAVYRLRDCGARLFVDATRLRVRLRHAAPTDPYRLYRVDPAAIIDSISWQELTPDRGEAIPHPLRLPNYHFAGGVLSGDWDVDRHPFADSVVYRSFRAHFEVGVPWPETDLYGQCLDTIDAGGTPWGCTTPADVDRRCREIDRLYERVDREGYRTQAELLASGSDAPLDHARPNKYTRTVDGEIALVVGRDGELLFYDGRNRLAIAKLLELETVPVVILARHSQWQALRDRVAAGERSLAGVPDRLQSHPDLVDLR
ncbi:hypothetical protein [Halohasta salina]|uniref:hypothetical protein n=1 Tax=Halohasta salina TaxID=2961621 RepID=UPI0020A2DDAD|nr:hypothetical protein [Halohasta salina]